MDYAEDFEAFATGYDPETQVSISGGEKDTDEIDKILTKNGAFRGAKRKARIPNSSQHKNLLMFMMEQVKIEEYMNLK